MMAVLFPETFLFSVEEKEGVLQIEKLYVHTSSKKEKRHLCPCLFTAFHNRNLMVSPPIRYSVLLLILLCVSVCVCVCVCVCFHSSFFPALGSFSHCRWLRVTDGLEK